MDNQSEQRHFFKGAFILTVAGLLSKILSAGYRIPLQNLTGDVGFYTYQQIYPFLGIAVILALYGFPAAISRFIAGQTGYLTKQTKRKILIQLCLSSLTVCIVIFSAAPWIAQFMGDHDLVGGIRVSAFPFLLVPFISYLRGVFQGQNNMVPTAVSQLVEQLFRVSLIIVAAFLVIYLNRSLYEIGIGTALAGTFGAMAALVVLVVYHHKDRKLPFMNAQMETSIDQSFFTAIIGYGIAIAINHMLLLLLQVVDAFTLVPLLKQTGVPLGDAQILKGVLDRGQPLAQLGIVTASSMALALIPSVTKARLKTDHKRSASYIASTWRFTLYLASGATIGLIVLFPEVNTLLFKEDLGTVSLQIFVVTIIFSAISISTASILQGFGQIYRTALFVLLGLVVKLAFNLLLVPLFDISGAAIATVLASVVIFLLNRFQLNKITPKTERITVPWIGFLLSLLLMAIVIFGLNGLASSLFYQSNRLGQLLYLIIFITIGIIVYLYCLIKFSVFTKEERQVIPFVSHLLKDE